MTMGKIQIFENSMEKYKITKTKKLKKDADMKWILKEMKGDTKPQNTNSAYKDSIKSQQKAYKTKECNSIITDTYINNYIGRITSKLRSNPNYEDFEFKNYKDLINCINSADTAFTIQIMKKFQHEYNSFINKGNKEENKKIYGGFFKKLEKFIKKFVQKDLQNYIVLISNKSSDGGKSGKDSSKKDSSKKDSSKPDEQRKCLVKDCKQMPKQGQKCCKSHRNESICKKKKNKYYFLIIYGFLIFSFI